MPFVRFSRDKRGYEHVYLIDSSSRRGKPARTRMLYWFRTPPGIKVGRQPFDLEMQRAVEAQNPGLKFDWPRIIATPMPRAEVEPWRERRRAERAVKRTRQAEHEETSAVDVEQPAADTEARSADAGQPNAPAEATPASGESREGQVSDMTAAGAQGGASSVPARRRRRRGGRRRRRSRAPGSAPRAAASASKSAPAVGNRENGALGRPDPALDSSQKGE